MATSQQKWRFGSLQLLLVAVALALAVFAGSAHAGKDYQECPHGYTDCKPHEKGGCADLKNDPYNCGYCHKKCYKNPHTETKCYDKECKYKCERGWGDCDYKWYNGCETNLRNDDNNCGRCHNKCRGKAICRDYQCKEPCKKGWKWDDKKKYCVHEYKH